MTIKSKTTPVVIFLFIITLFCVIIFAGICEGDIVVPIFVGVLLLLITVRYWIATGRVFTLSEKGCEVRFLCFKQAYSWDQFMVKKEESCQGYISYKNQYTDGVYFSRRKVHKPDWMSPVDYSLWIHPFSFVFINFRKANLTKTEKALPTVYEVERELFIRFMNEWNIKIEKE